MSRAAAEIVLYSKGVCSAYIAARLKETCVDPLCLFNDTKREDEDTYRFGDEVAAKWGLNVVEASDGRDLYDFFRQQRIIPARQIPACSIALKIKPGAAFLAALEGPGRVAYGYDLNEEDRAERTIANWAHPHLTPWFPLIEWGVSKRQCFGFFLERGVEVPRIYRHFRNANCLPCKNFRMNDWVALRYHYPEKFAEAQALEEEIGSTWMQEGTPLKDVPDVRPKVRRLAMAEPAFNFEMGCDRCAAD